mmetsp:Transcript_93427/g.302473  ORF Transcript_93427/g.302473 Transcript_93427/m.302473 type:complete len:209 (+) Transcript_93427:3733-4359(+)
MWCSFNWCAILLAEDLPCCAQMETFECKYSISERRVLQSFLCEAEVHRVHKIHMQGSQGFVLADLVHLFLPRGGLPASPSFQNQLGQTALSLVHLLNRRVFGHLHFPAQQHCQGHLLQQCRLVFLSAGIEAPPLQLQQHLSGFCHNLCFAQPDVQPNVHYTTLARANAVGKRHPMRQDATVTVHRLELHGPLIWGGRCPVLSGPMPRS